MSKSSQPWDGSWIVGRSLGKGGQGETYEVTSRSGHTDRAVLKVLRNNKASQARGRMHREVASLEVLAAEGGAVPRVYEHNTQSHHDGSIQLYMVMEYIPGPTLREQIDTHGPLSVEIARRIVASLSKTVELAHGFSILHRDLKPENIIVRDLDKGDAVIVDYGLSFNAESEDVTIVGESFRNKFLDLPETNTPGGNRRDSRSDVTALCGILYFVLTGHVPGQLHGGDGRPPHRRYGVSIRESLGNEPRISPLEALFDRGFSPNIDVRFQTVQEFAERLAFACSPSSAFKSEDPILVAKRAASLMRKHDRSTKIANYRQRADTFMHKLQTVVVERAGTLEGFAIQVQLERIDADRLPITYDKVLDFGLVIQLWPENHLCKSVAVYVVVARTEQCAVLKRAYRSKDAPAANLVEVTGWEEVMWYDGESIPDTQDVSNNVLAWISNSINALVDEVLAGDSK